MKDDKLKLPSKTFCILPFVHLATHPHGTVTLCCESDPTDGLNQARDYNEDRLDFMNLKDNTIEEVMNSDYFKEVRCQMLAGERPPACEVCFRKELDGINSKRDRENKLHAHMIPLAADMTDVDGTLNKLDLRYLELRLGNVCNVKCRSCNPVSSSRWMKDHKELKPRVDFLKFDYEFVTEFTWPESDRFWEEVMEMAPNVENIYINGGEPTLIKRHWKFLNDLVANGTAKNIKLWYSVNMTRMPEDQIQVWKEFREVQIEASIDDVGDRNHYIRYPTQWDDVLTSIETLKRNDIKMGIMQTISIMNIYYLDEFWKFGEEVGARVSFNYVNEPHFLNPRRIPKILRDVVISKLADSNVLPDYRMDEVRALLGDKEEDDEQAWHEFCTFTKEMDDIRGQSFKETFPEFYDVIKWHGFETP